jgi:FkbM family methyltransferase
MAYKKAVRKALYRFPSTVIVWRWHIRYMPEWLVHPWINELVNNFLRSCPRDFASATTWGAHFQGNTVDILQRYLYLYGVWEPNLTAWLSERLHGGDVFIDVGANIGYYSVLAAKRVAPDGHVVAIEPFSSIFAVLRRHIDSNSVRNVRLVNEAASNRGHRVALFRAPPTNMGASSIINAPAFEPAGEVNARPLFEILSPDEIRRARIIKIDVEGAELAVVRGLLPTLPAVRSDFELVVEVGGGPPTSPSARMSCDKICHLLKPLGFHPYKLLNSYAASAYLSRPVTTRPCRLRNGVDEETDLIFSRMDAEHL